MNILFFSAKPYEIEYFSKLNQKFKHQIKYIDSRLNESTAILAKGFEAICAFDSR